MSGQDAQNGFSLIPSGTRELAVTQTTQNRILGEMVEKSLSLARVTPAIGTIDLDVLVYEGKRLYREKEGMIEENLKAFEFFHRAAQGGHNEARYYIGCCYRNGDGVHKNNAVAMKWFEESANAGYYRAQIRLGVDYIEGTGDVSKSKTEAIRWFQRAAESSPSDIPCILIAGIYKDLNDHEQDLSWKKEAALRGNWDNPSPIARAYENSAELECDVAEAYAWLELIADHSQNETYQQRVVALADRMSAFEIEQGNRLYGGYKEQMAEWKRMQCEAATETARKHRKAAELGYAFAQNLLGICFQYGNGVEVDLSQAYAWLQLAADQNHERAKYEASALAALMSPTEFSAADALYCEFKEKFSTKQ